MTAQLSRERLEEIKEFGCARIIKPISDEEILALVDMALAGMDSEPVAYPEKLPCPVLLEPGMRFGKGVKTRLMLEAIQRRAKYYAELDNMTPEQRAEHDAGIEGLKAMLPAPVAVPDDYGDVKFKNCLKCQRENRITHYTGRTCCPNCGSDEWDIAKPLLETSAPVAVPDDIDALRKDAARYRFLRDKDAFGEENESGLVTWDELAELELNDFDAEIDARMNHPNVAWVAQVDSGGGDSMAEVYSELYRLREEVKGPEGFATWKDAAIAERISKKSARNIPDEIDYLHAMATFHSDQWHKMGPITGYMHGWNAFRVALKAGPVTAATVPDGWKLVPVEPTEAMLDAAYSHPASTEDRMRKQYASMLAAAPAAPEQEV